VSKPRLRATPTALAEALRGNFTRHHAILARVMLTHIDQLTATIATLDAEVDREIARLAAQRDRLDTIPGVSKRAAEALIAEIGVDMSRFPTAGHLASWAGMCPANNECAGKTHHSGKTRKGDPWLRGILGEIAATAGRSRTTALGERYGHLARRGKKRALVATGHTVLVAAWHLLANASEDTDLGS
jgi:transposase